ncbi:hypothetical protein [Pseudonocardia humida]|uniref:Uncharacterized protein n=1 Tax=Pseudonocardia humida TaxID=2800819 RepID=A0ABT0ZWK9_9PSEU|nr:hypothetical protein [Pseudonocardia humida]MCO1655134.1 hypothetical protein [Pseudonocardia humida]
MPLLVAPALPRNALARHVQPTLADDLSVLSTGGVLRPAVRLPSGQLRRRIEDVREQLDELERRSKGDG